MRLTELVPVPDNINPGLSPARQATMLSLLGAPRSSYSQECQSVENPRLAKLMKVASAGPFRVYGLSQAVDDLVEIFAAIKSEHPDVYEALGYAGMLCARYVRGSTYSVSNHAWGTAVDLKLDAHLDSPGDNLVQHGLTLIAPIFNRYGWYWGAGFRREDAMHFEASEQLIWRWFNANKPGEPIRSEDVGKLSLGDRGPEVREWQQFLVAQGYDVGPIDGSFGPRTQIATESFQRASYLASDGVVGPQTRSKMEAKPSGTPALRRMKNSELTPSIIRQASAILRTMLDKPMGAETAFTSGNLRLVARLEWHYDERRGRHKGISVFVNESPAETESEPNNPHPPGLTDDQVLETVELTAHQALDELAEGHFGRDYDREKDDRGTPGNA